MDERLADVRVAILGGTGQLGRGLARRFAAAGIPVALGSRDAARAAEAAAAYDGLPVTGADHATACAEATVVVVAVPYDGHADLLRSLQPALSGKVVVDCVNPLGFDRQGAFALPVDEGSAAQQAAALLPSSTVVAAFHHLSAAVLDSSEDVDSDVLVLGDERSATDLVQALAETIPGCRGVYGGRLRNAGQVEALTANLISVNRRYQIHAGVRVGGLG